MNILLYAGDKKMELAVILKTLGDDIRLRIIRLLLDRELCVCDIESVLGISQANASCHLAKMKTSGILSSRKTAQWVYYSINPELTAAYPEFLKSLKSELGRGAVYKEDLKTLDALKKTGKSKC
jgi:ArsR family transcriptional regulator, arsenate/arsenite/antimonite-responsive transcriptional repressor